MKYWTRYWSRLWDMDREEQARREPSEADSGREHAPPAPRQARRPQMLPDVRLGDQSSGHPLPAPTRRRLEASLGVDLSSIKVHRDEAAAHALNARAFAMGEEIVVGRESDADDPELLGHEAAHIAQTRSRGVFPGVSNPESAGERQAKAAGLQARSGREAYLPAAGGPTPAVQRQEEESPAPAPANPVVRRESVRLLLTIQYQQQGEPGGFQLTPTVITEMRRLIPQLTQADISRLWTPEPANPIEAFQRIVNAGYLPLVSLEPEPDLIPPPVAEPEPKQERSKVPFGMGMVGFHYRLNPRVPPPVSAQIRQQLSSRAIPLSYRDIDRLLAGRKQGIYQLERILSVIVPGMVREQRRELAETIADAMLDHGLQGQLVLEHPTRVELTERQVEIFQQARGDLPSLLEKLPVGASLTIYF